MNIIQTENGIIFYINVINIFTLMNDKREESNEPD